MIGVVDRTSGANRIEGGFLEVERLTTRLMSSIICSGTQISTAL